MENFLQLLIGQSEWNALSGQWLPVGFKVVLAIICGGMIGLERELKHKPAGLRTNILICLGAVLFTTLSVLIAATAEPGHPSDPARIAAQVVTGVGFLGGGMILQSGGSVTGPGIGNGEAGVGKRQRYRVSSARRTGLLRGGRVAVRHRRGKDFPQ